MDSWVDWQALWKIVVVGMLAGAGLPALFAIGLRALSTGPRGSNLATADDDVIYGGNVYGLLIAMLCFAVVLAAVGWGIYSLVVGA